MIAMPDTVPPPSRDALPPTYAGAPTVCLCRNLGVLDNDVARRSGSAPRIAPARTDSRPVTVFDRCCNVCILDGDAVDRTVERRSDGSASIDSRSRHASASDRDVLNGASALTRSVPAERPADTSAVATAFRSYGTSRDRDVLGNSPAATSSYTGTAVRTIGHHRTPVDGDVSTVPVLTPAATYAGTTVRGNARIDRAIVDGDVRAGSARTAPYGRTAPDAFIAADCLQNESAAVDGDVRTRFTDSAPDARSRRRNSILIPYELARPRNGQCVLAVLHASAAVCRNQRSFPRKLKIERARQHVHRRLSHSLSEHVSRIPCIDAHRIEGDLGRNRIARCRTRRRRVDDDAIRRGRSAAHGDGERGTCQHGENVVRVRPIRSFRTAFHKKGARRCRCPNFVQIHIGAYPCRRYIRRARIESIRRSLTRPGRIPIRRYRKRTGEQKRSCNDRQHPNQAAKRPPPIFGRFERG